MIYFLSIYCLVIILSFTDFNKKYKRLGAIAIIILLAMLAGFRNMGGMDFLFYKDLYNRLALNYLSSEFGYALFNNLFSSLGFSFNFFLFVYTFISVYFMVSFLEKYTPFPKFSILFYMASYFFYYNMVLNRQMICITAVLWVLFLWNKNKLCSLFVLFSAFLFHQSIIVILPFLLIFEMIKNSKGVICWGGYFIFAIVITLVVNPIDFSNYISFIPGLSFVTVRTLDYFSKTEVSLYTLNKLEYLKMFLMLLILLPCLKTILKNKENKIWVFFYFTGLIVMFWTRNIEILFRVFVYFDLSLLFLLPLCLNIFITKFPSEQKKTVLLFSYGLMGILALASIYYRISNFDHGVFLLYKFYFLEV